MHAHHLDVVDLAVAAHQHHDQLVVGTHQHTLDGILWRIAEEVADVFDGCDVWRLDLFDRRRVVLILAGHRLRFGDLDVGSKVTAVAIRDRRFAIFSQHHEFVRVAAADLTTVSQHWTEFQPAAREDTAVSVVHFAISLIQPRFIHVEGIEILHHKFATAHQPKTWTTFVTIFVLDLIETQRQLLVAANELAADVCDNLLVRWPQAKFAPVAVNHAHHLVAIRAPSTAFLPELRRLRDRHQDLLPIGSVHLLAHDLLHLRQHALAQRQIGVHPCSHLLDIARLQKQLMAWDLRFSRHVAQRRDQSMFHSHKINNLQIVVRSLFTTFNYTRCRSRTQSFPQKIFARQRPPQTTTDRRTHSQSVGTSVRRSTTRSLPSIPRAINTPSTTRRSQVLTGKSSVYVRVTPPSVVS